MSHWRYGKLGTELMLHFKLDTVKSCSKANVDLCKVLMYYGIIKNRCAKIFSCLVKQKPTSATKTIKYLQMTFLELTQNSIRNNLQVLIGNMTHWIQTTLSIHYKFSTYDYGLNDSLYDIPKINIFSVILSYFYNTKWYMAFVLIIRKDALFFQGSYFIFIAFVRENNCYRQKRNTGTWVEPAKES